MLSGRPHTQNGSRESQNLQKSSRGTKWNPRKVIIHHQKRALPPLSTNGCRPLKDDPHLLAGGEKKTFFFILKLAFLEFHLVSRDDSGIFEDFGVSWTRFWKIFKPATLCPQISNICWKRPKNGLFLDHGTNFRPVTPKIFSTKIFQKMREFANYAPKSPILMVIHALVDSG